MIMFQISFPSVVKHLTFTSQYNLGNKRTQSRLETATKGMHQRSLQYILGKNEGYL